MVRPEDVPRVKLNNGKEIPVIGLGTLTIRSAALVDASDFTLAGTWQSQADQVTSAVEYALKEAGYRHIDCAFVGCSSPSGRVHPLTDF
jgi:glycerol 2-dehydrogenase (NADP+)